MTKQSAVLDENGRALITEEQARKGKTLLASFGSRKELNEMMDRILRTLTVFDPTLGERGNTRRLTQAEALQVASIALAHGLDPFAKEIYPMMTKRSGFSVGIGRDGWSKALAYAIEREGGGHAWPIFRQVTDEFERSTIAQGAPAGAIVIVCELHDSRSHDAVTDLIKAMTAAGATWKEIDARVGKPFVEGVGWYAPNNATRYNDENYPPLERAKKRAYCAAIKMRAHLPFDVGEGSDDLPDDYTGSKVEDSRPAAPVSETIVEQRPSETAEEHATRKSDARAVFGDETTGPDATAASETVVEQQTETPLEVERKRYTSLFNRASKLKLKPSPFSIFDSAITLKGKGDALEAQIKAAEQF